jgi:hypothetical protein
VVASWLAAISRRELSRFREFVLWLRFGTSPFDENAYVCDFLARN